MMNKKCRLCFSDNLSELINLGPQPIAHKMLSLKDDNEDRYLLALHRCLDCGLIQICEPIPSEKLYLDYNYCFSSWKPQPHIDDEIDMILSEEEINSALEVGCNDGFFLEHLKQKGVNLVAGIEPNKFASKIAKERVSNVYTTLLSKESCQGIVAELGKFDIVIARQVLEHLPNIHSFFECADILLKENGILFIDIPDNEKAIAVGDCSFVWEEHVSYFLEPVIMNSLKKFGYNPIAMRKYNFSGGITAILSRRQQTVNNETRKPILEKEICQFSDNVLKYGKQLKETLQRYKELDYGIVLYGVGCRACTVVNGLSLGDYIDFAVDDQKERQGKYMPGSRLEVFSLEKMYALDKRVICLLAVNQENEKKVKEKINKDNIESISLFSPNDIWKELAELNNKEVIEKK